MEKIIKEVITKIFGKCEIYIFGSFLTKPNPTDIEWKKGTKYMRQKTFLEKNS
ncbi:MAG: hypothetical protein GXO62_00150 [Epsilonproteobacteria bacterium]|nr:hypothetical protein [Campylobacterota bacterium]